MRLPLLLGVVLAVAVPLPATAEVIYVEDFEDANGDPAFDPVFSHEFSGIGSYPPHWAISSETVYPEHGWVLGLTGIDLVRFDLEPEESVSYASVEYRGMPNSKVTFVGLAGEEEIWLDSHSQYHTIEMSSTQIGFITEIRLLAGEGLFDNVTIRVVPEPFAIVLLATGASVVFMLRGRSSAM